MSEKTLTEKDAVLREREAFKKGCDLVFAHFGISSRMEFHQRIGTWSGSERNAKIRYPLPTETRPRVVKDPTPDLHTIGDRKGGREFRVYEGQMQTRDPLSGEYQWSCIEGGFLNAWGRGLSVTPARVALWADLLARPTEVVDDD